MDDRTSAPETARRAFRHHKSNAGRRGIPFLFDFTEWWAWWNTDGRWERRGMGSVALVMARRGDTGPYSPGNVVCLTHAENIAAVPPAVRARASVKAWEAVKARGDRCHLAVRGDGHPCSRAVVTPLGRFGSAALAAEAHGITRQNAAALARERRKGWRREEDDRSLPK